jgi:Tol biopolymer transport system component
MVQTTAPVPARALTSPPKGVQDTMPMWSPNGREILFQRLGPGDKQCGLYLIPASGGEPRNVSTCKHGELASFSWFPDGRRLVGSELGAVNDDDGALHVLDLDTGAWTRLPYHKAPSDIDLGPMVSPDGRWIAFRRNISLSDVWRVPATGGEPERLTDLRANLFGVAWTPDSRALVVSRYQDAGVQLARIDVASHTVRDLGVADGYYPAIAARASSLAFVVGQTQSAMYRLDATHPDAAPQALFPSTGLDLLPSVSPDGTQVVWMSNRSGRLALWWARWDQPESLRLIDGIVPMPRYTAVWSADSRQLLVIGREGNRQVLFEVHPESGRVQRLPVPAGEPVYAEYHPTSGRLLVVADRGSGRLGLTLYDRSRTPWAPVAQLDDVAMTRVDAAHDRLLFTRPTTPGLWQADLDLRNVRALGDKPDVGGGRRIALLPDGLWTASNESKCGLQWGPLDGSRPPGPCRHPGSMLAGITYDGVHKQLFYAVEREQSPDIGWMPLPAH